MRAGPAALLACVLTFPVVAQQSDSVFTALPEVALSARHIGDSLLTAPASVSVLGPHDLMRGENANIAPAVNTVAGVQMQSGAYNTSRLSIRGIGARTPFGTNKVRAFYGNIPLTSGDGETTLDDIDPEAIGQVEIIKGPMAGIYGAGLAGAVIITPVAAGISRSAGAGSLFGAYGFERTGAQIDFGNGKATLHLAYRKLASDGWRQNSAYRRESTTATGEVLRGRNMSLRYLFNFTDLKAYIPSSLSQSQFDENPRAAAATWRDAKGFEQYGRMLSGLTLESRLGQSVRNATSIYLTYKRSDEPRPFNILREKTLAGGLRTQFTADFKHGISAIAGAEYFTERYRGSTSENDYAQNGGNGSLQGNLLSALAETRRFANVFLQARLALSPHWEIQSGLNADLTGFVYENTFPASFSQDKSYPVQWSPQASVLYRRGKAATYYLSASRGFSMPTIEETLNADGTVNTSIRPENGYQYEIGAKRYFDGRHILVQAALFRIEVRDQLVAQRLADDQYRGVNAGRTRHQGIEASANARYRIAGSRIDGYLSANYGQFRFLDFSDNGVRYDGRDLSGVPRAQAASGISLNGDRGWFVSADGFFSARQFANDANTAYAPGYFRFDAKAGWRVTAGKLEMTVSAGAANLFDAHYAAMVQVNALAPAGGQPRYFYPGLPQHFYGGVSLRYAL